MKLGQRKCEHFEIGSPLFEGREIVCYLFEVEVLMTSELHKQKHQ